MNYRLHKKNFGRNHFQIIKDMSVDNALRNFKREKFPREYNQQRNSNLNNSELINSSFDYAKDSRRNLNISDGNIRRNLSNEPIKNVGSQESRVRPNYLQANIDELRSNSAQAYVKRKARSNGNIHYTPGEEEYKGGNIMLFNNFKMHKDKIMKKYKQREVKSEERVNGINNGRRIFSKQNFEQRPILPVNPDNQSKKMYYLEFLSGQPVWNLVKDRENKFGDNTQRIESLEASSLDKYKQEKNYKTRSKPKVNIIKSKHGKAFCNINEYKNQAIKPMKNIAKPLRNKERIFKQQTEFLPSPEMESDPLSMTFNKSGNNTSMKECPYKNCGSDLTKTTSASTKKRESDQNIQFEVSIDSSKKAMESLNSQKIKKGIFSSVNIPGLSKSDLHSPKKRKPQVFDQKSQRNNDLFQGIKHRDLLNMSFQDTAIFKNDKNEYSKGIPVKPEINSYYNSETKVKNYKESFKNKSLDKEFSIRNMSYGENQDDPFLNSNSSKSFEIRKHNTSANHEMPQTQQKIVRQYRNPKTLALSSKIPSCFLEATKARHRKKNSCELGFQQKSQNLNALKLTFKAPWKSRMKQNDAKFGNASFDPNLQIVGHR
ncbi:unnamed protein product [Moneuplotes crassus]|uniref:Uncharacterized protein n=1 Tax=Euplotes crassus TaxID=5936 RepID=A0AAD1Y3T1_EUPCR|nr:unnamed protein product [Moneuplotes crassus]